MDLLTRIFNVLWNLQPFFTVQPDQGAVQLRGGKYHRTLFAGFYFKIPIYDIILRLPIKEQLVNLTNQSVKDKAGHNIAVSGVIRYEVEDPRKALLEVYNWDESLQNLAMAEVATFISQTKSSPMQEVEKEVLDELNTEAENWGINILDFRLTDYADHRVLRLMSDSSLISGTPTPRV